jgi:hypothetical protein
LVADLRTGPQSSGAPDESHRGGIEGGRVVVAADAGANSHRFLHQRNRSASLRPSSGDVRETCNLPPNFGVDATSIQNLQHLIAGGQEVGYDLSLAGAVV